MAERPLPKIVEIRMPSGSPHYGSQCPECDEWSIGHASEADAEQGARDHDCTAGDA